MIAIGSLESWEATGEYRLKIGDFAPTGAGWPKISRRTGRPGHHQPFLFSENKAKRSFVWYRNLDRFFFRFVTKHAFDRQTDGQTDRRNSHIWLDRVCIARSGVVRRSFYFASVSFRPLDNSREVFCFASLFVDTYALISQTVERRTVKCIPAFELHVKSLHLPEIWSWLNS